MLANIKEFSMTEWYSTPSHRGTLYREVEGIYLLTASKATVILINHRCCRLLISAFWTYALRDRVDGRPGVAPDVTAWPFFNSGMILP